MATSLIYSSDFLKHDTGYCPENTTRYELILAALERDATLWNTLLKKQPRKALPEDILRCHTPELLNTISDKCMQGGGYLDADTAVCEASYDIGFLSAGAALVAIDDVCQGVASNAFSLSRPPGHHATPNQAMGFCLFNNAAIAARYAQTQYQLKNILIIDWDVHHGNGTQDIFYDDPSVFYASLHEYPFYPNTGAAHETGIGAGAGTTLNIPLPAGIPAAEYRKAFTHALHTIENKFKPDLIIISAGFDARKGDPLADFLLTKQDYFAMTKELMALANKHCGGKLISVLEGGYVSDSLGDTVKEHIAALHEH